MNDKIAPPPPQPGGATAIDADTTMSMCENMFFISWNNFLYKKVLVKKLIAYFCNNFHNFVSLLLHNVSLFQKLMFKFKLTKFH